MILILSSLNNAPVTASFDHILHACIRIKDLFMSHFFLLAIDPEMKVPSLGLKCEPRIKNAAYCCAAGHLRLPPTCRQTESGQARWSNLCSFCSLSESWGVSSSSDHHLKTNF